MLPPPLVSGMSAGTSSSSSSSSSFSSSAEKPSRGDANGTTEDAGTDGSRSRRLRGGDDRAQSESNVTADRMYLSLYLSLYLVCCLCLYDPLLLRSDDCWAAARSEATVTQSPPQRSASPSSAFCCFCLCLFIYLFIYFKRRTQKRRRHRERSALWAGGASRMGKKQAGERRRRAPERGAKAKRQSRERANGFFWTV